LKSKFIFQDPLIPFSLQPIKLSPSEWIFQRHHITRKWQKMPTFDAAFATITFKKMTSKVIWSNTGPKSWFFHQKNDRQSCLRKQKRSNVDSVTIPIPR
jgi:hypothetical protein